MSYTLVRHSDNADFDSLRAQGFTTVVVDGWGFSTSSLSRVWSSQSVIDEDDGMHTASCYKATDGPVAEWEHHPTLDGVKFATRDDASRAAYEAGVLAFFIPDRKKVHA